ncbi:MAG: hypothetical protein VB080_14665 [Propionicimonas sp.]|uniref:hypothetical protein n=1 Tax=Propionicimonas sp. TaxID=1955623 RepID=UPI002B1EF27C|nr:hypothetical protein [Propionicimonas sp.]MEA4945663.1 hypothetical protein [Propionicimonas sp.]MEA5116582.1 hypothetical protein [Propionicimonas sp.]
MQSDDFMYVVLADQVASRAGSDRVPDALRVLGERLGGRLALPFERTAGDEIQGLTADPAAVIEAVCALTRLGGWRLGIGTGSVDLPLPRSTREARGDAYLAARQAIGAARTSPTELALRTAPTVSPAGYGGPQKDKDAETALWLLRTVLASRSREGWELVDLLDQGLSNAQAASRLGISPSAASQRLSRAHRTEVTRGAALAARLLADLAPDGGRQ